MTARTLLPIQGDPNRWYISGRTAEVYGRLSLSAAEFHALSHLFPMVAQMKGRRYECACITPEDSRMAELALAAIRMCTHYDAGERGTEEVGL